MSNISLVSPSAAHSSHPFASAIWELENASEIAKNNAEVYARDGDTGSAEALFKRHESLERAITHLAKAGEQDEPEVVVTENTITEILAGAECPLPLEVIPNYMGINLCSVASVRWGRLPDRQLTELSIKFIPEPLNTHKEPVK